MIAPTKHFRLSPSGSTRWLPCPYSARNDLPESSHPTAALGHQIHGLAGEVLVGRATLDDVPEDWQAGVEMYVEHIHGNGGEYYTEQQWVSPTIKDFGGTTDCTIFKDNKVAVYDFKTGKWPVEAEGNTQLLCYLSIIAEHHPELDEFYGVIVQPKSKNREKIKIAEFEAWEIQDHYNAVKEAAVSNHKATGVHCRFCPLRPTCDEGSEYAQIKGWK